MLSGARSRRLISVLQGAFDQVIKMKTILAATLVASTTLAGAASAATMTWDGNGDPDNSGDWNVAANWNPDQAPGPGDDVLIPAVTGGADRTITIPPGDPVVVNSISSTGGNSAKPSVVNVQTDLTVSLTDITDNRFEFGILAGKTLTIDNADKAVGFRNMTGRGTLIKQGAGQLVIPGFWPNWGGFTGTFQVEQGTVGSLEARDDGNFVYFGNANLVIDDGAMVSVRSHQGASVAASVTINGSGLAGGTGWNANAGALRFYLDSGLETHRCDFLIVGDGGGTIGAERLWPWAAASLEARVGTVNGNGTLSKVGECVMTLDGNVGNAGGVVIREGGLHLDGSNVTGDVTINMPPDPLPYDPDSITKLTGTAIIDGKLTMENGSILFPRQIGPGREVAAPQHLSAGSTELGGITYEWHINDAQGTAGINWDLLDAGTALHLTATSVDPMTIKIVSLDQTNDPGSVHNFDNTRHYSWTIARADTITGFSPDAVAIDATEFQHDLGDGEFSIVVAGGDLNLRYLPTLYGDVTGDCKVDILDMIAVRNHLGERVVSGDNDVYDVTGDAKIDILDMIAVRNELTQQCPGL